MEYITFNMAMYVSGPLIRLTMSITGLFWKNLAMVVQNLQNHFCSLGGDGKYFRDYFNGLEVPRWEPDRCSRCNYWWIYSTHFCSDGSAIALSSETISELKYFGVLLRLENHSLPPEIYSWENV